MKNLKHSLNKNQQKKKKIMKLKLSNLAITLLAVGAFATTQANADTITTPILTTGTMTTELTNVPLSLQLFNSNLGTLTGVSITISGELNTGAGSSVTNHANTSQTFTVSENVLYNFSDSGLLSAQLANLTTDPSYSKTYKNLGAGASAAFGPVSLTSGTTLNFSSGLSAFSKAGGGSDIVDVNTTTNEGLAGGGGNVSYLLNTTGAATLQVTYTYEAIPEPSSIALALLGGTGMLLLMQRRRRNATSL